MQRNTFRQSKSFKRSKLVQSETATGHAVIETVSPKTKSDLVVAPQSDAGVMRSLPTLSTVYGTLATSFSMDTPADQDAVFDAHRNVYRQAVTIESSIPFKMVPKVVTKEKGVDTHIFVIRMVPTERQHFRFLDLPAEIRAMILRECLTAKDPIRVDFARHSKRGVQPPKTYQSVPSAMLHVNRHLHSEAAPIFYGVNTFIFISSTLFGRFIKMIKGNADYLRDAKILHWVAASGFSAIAAFPQCHSLERLSLPDNCASHNMDENGVETLYKALQGYFARRSGADGGVESALNSVTIGRCNQTHGGAPLVTWIGRRWVHSYVCQSCEFHGKIRKRVLEAYPAVEKK
ncbi:hypothetical protein KVT40_008827 [Elsinoe batatas]|uniref:2EXR domain-containing protein n=1 Tax=Elsinoe batatas TaxID=2601811 RepID=A0A8K0PBW0_9PEZI|nr:hypothetical protein KVT40_008827 [Elsinoe batatas]